MNNLRPFLHIKSWYLYEFIDNEEHVINESDRKIQMFLREQSLQYIRPVIEQCVRVQSNAKYIIQQYYLYIGICQFQLLMDAYFTKYLSK